MIIVTGGAGFIGSNLVRALNARGHEDVVVVDDLSDGRKFANIADCHISDYLDKEDFLARLGKGVDPVQQVTAVFHQGACTRTTEWDGRYMMRNNYDYSKTLFHYCTEHEIPFIYASSAAVYGTNHAFHVQRDCERPLNVYAYSKFLFDQYVRRHWDGIRSQVVGLRYFNAYGPREQHKEAMASMVHHLYHQLKSTGQARLFKGSDGYGDGEQRRDFVHVDDACAVNLWFLVHPACSGIFNVGTGASESFNSIAQAIIHQLGYGEIEYIPFPETLQGHYQSFTQADIQPLRQAGFQQPFKSISEGIPQYIDWLEHTSSQ